MTKERLEEIMLNIANFNKSDLYNVVQEITVEILKMETIPDDICTKLMDLLKYATDQLAGDEDGKTDDGSDCDDCEK